MINTRSSGLVVGIHMYLLTPSTLLKKLDMFRIWAESAVFEVGSLGAVFCGISGCICSKLWYLTTLVTRGGIFTKTALYSKCTGPVRLNSLCLLF